MVWRSPRSLWSLFALSTAVVALALPATAALALQPRVVVAGYLPIPARDTVVDTPLTTSFDIALRQANTAQLQSFLSNLSNPASPNYRHFLTTSQFAHQYGARTTTVAAVRDYLSSFGLHIGELSRGRTILHVRGSTTAIARAFATTVVTVRRSDGVLAAQFGGSATLPADVAHDVVAIAGLSSVVPPHSESVRSHASRASAPGLCPAAGASTNTPNPLGGYTLQQQAQLYGLTGAWARGQTGVGQTIGVYELGSYNPNDVTRYLNCYGESHLVTKISVDGGSTGGFSDEATLDVEEAAGLAPGAAIKIYAGPNSNSGPTDVYQKMADDNSATIITTSWGTCESDPSGGAAGTEQVIFEQMAAQGQTVISAAGDSGSSDCAGITNNKLAVDDPASQPFVTGVGGLSVTSVTPLVQTVWNDGVNSGGGAGGGGQSTLWSRPAWQQAPGILSSNTMRMVPDLSVMADSSTGFIQYFSGSNGASSGGWGSVGGTSIGSPLVSALVAVAAQSCGQGRLGFLNPALYQMAATGFNDVTSGSNDLFGQGAYSAAIGYDMASGLGSPNPSTFMAGLCPPTFSPASSSFLLTNTKPVVNHSAKLTVTLRNSSSLPIANATVNVTATTTSGLVLIDNDHSSETGGGNAAYSVTTNQNGVAILSVTSSSPGPVVMKIHYQSQLVFATTLHFVATPPTTARRATAPTIVTLTPLVASFHLSVKAPTYTGGRKIRTYQYSINGGLTWVTFSATTKSTTVAQLVKRKTYRVIVRAVNSFGPGAPSMSSVVTTR